MQRNISMWKVTFYTLLALSAACFTVWFCTVPDTLTYQAQPQKDLYGFTYTGTVTYREYPDRTLTPGVIATSDFNVLTAKTNGQTYSATNRNTSQKLKDTVCHEYYSNCKGMEIDHLIPLALGGADVQANLWPQKGTGKWNFHDKDRLETYLVNQMKAGYITPNAAQQCILRDWVSCYQTYFSNTQFGAVGSVTDSEDVVE